MNERFQVEYHITGDADTALARARDICLEQTVETDDELVPDGFIRDTVVGKMVDFTSLPGENNRFRTLISYAVDTTAFELTQLLNLVFGNSSIKAGIRVVDIQFSPALLAHFRGPTFGIPGLRQLLGVLNKPLLCTALKPMGKSPAELAEMAYQFALGGLDIIKDDHGLSDQPFCRYQARVEACAAAVAKANQETGLRCMYAPNVTAPFPVLMERALFAKQAGAGALLIAPGLTGFDAMRTLAADENVHLPLLSHPALLGSMVTAPDNGFSHALLFGYLQRLAGADASIYPNYGGRFGFSREQCHSIADACLNAMGPYASIFPTPGGGMNLQRVPELLALYGTEVLFLIGGALLAHSPDLRENARYFLSLVGR